MSINLLPLKMLIDAPVGDANRDTELEEMMKTAKQELITILGFSFDATENITEKAKIKKRLYTKVRPITTVNSLTLGGVELTEDEDFINWGRYIEILGDTFYNIEPDGVFFEIDYDGGIDPETDAYRPYNEVMALIAFEKLNIKKPIQPYTATDYRTPTAIQNKIEGLKDWDF